MATFKQHTLNWRQPILDSVVRYLADHHVQNGHFDLGRLVAVLPSGVGARRLLQRLVLFSEARGWSFVPPRISTVGGLPELLYQPKRPFAENEVQLLAWQHALKRLSPEDLQDLLATPPEPSDFFGWLELAQLMQSLHRELASDILSFADVIKVGLEGGDLPDQRRWAVLEKIQTQYLAILDELGFWDRQTARSMAIQFRECHTDQEVLIIGAVDLNGSMRAMLDQIASKLTLLKFGNPEEPRSFDRYGCLDLQFWEAPAITLGATELVVTDTPDDQALAVMNFFEQCDPDLTVEALTIGVPDDSLSPYLVRHAEAFDLSLHESVGRPLEQLPIGLWLQSLVDWVEFRSYSALASLVRHPAVFAQLSRQLGHSTWLNVLDEYHGEHLPALMTGVYGGPRGAMVSALLKFVDQWCAQVSTSQERRLGDWGAAWLECLNSWWQGCELDRENSHERATLTGLSKLRDALCGFEQLPREMQPKVRSTHAMRWAIRIIRGERLTGDSPGEAIPMMGWLDLPWDDGSHVVVCGFNEGVVPSSEKNDLFLPNSLRKRLGIMHSSRRFARDAYYLNLLICSKEKLRLIVGRRNAENEPLIPSRLLFHDEEDSVVSRALQCFDSEPLAFRVTSVEERTQRGSTEESPAVLGLPIPVSPESPWTLSPTDFGRYLRCPYRFYLSKYLRLRTSDDLETELGPGQFGDLIHEVLKRFGKSKVRHSEQESVISKQLSMLLDEIVRERFEHSHLPALDMQFEHAHRRLQDFSMAQAEWAASGWRIQEVEQSDIALQLKTELGPVAIHGRFDRLDYHPEEDRWMLLDYKSSDAGLAPEETHRQKKRDWIDLQLPLYYWMLRGSDPNKVKVDVGYVVLSRDSDKNGFKVAAWGPEVFQSALERAEEIATLIVGGEFWPPKKFSASEQDYDDFDALLTLPAPNDSNF